MKCRLIVPVQAGLDANPDDVIIDGNRRCLPAGTEIEDPNCYLLVHGGFAEAVDEECRERVAQEPQESRGLLREVDQRVRDEQAEFEYELQQEEEEDDD